MVIAKRGFSILMARCILVLVFMGVVVILFYAQTVQASFYYSCCSLASANAQNDLYKLFSNWTSFHRNATVDEIRGFFRDNYIRRGRSMREVSEASLLAEEKGIVWNYDSTMGDSALMFTSGSNEGRILREKYQLNFDNPWTSVSDINNYFGQKFMNEIVRGVSENCSEINKVVCKGFEVRKRVKYPTGAINGSSPFANLNNWAVFDALSSGIGLCGQIAGTLNKALYDENISVDMVIAREAGRNMLHTWNVVKLKDENGRKVVVDIAWYDPYPMDVRNLNYKDDA